MQRLPKVLTLSISCILIGSSILLAQTPATDVPAEPVEKVEKTVPEKKELPKETKEAKIEPENKAQKKAIKVFGWKEWVWAVKPDLIMRAKLDTGARTSSIHATNIEEVEIDGKKWIKFTISDPLDDKSLRLRHKAPLLRIGKIKNDTGGLDERFVVPLSFQIGNQKCEGEFNLNNREKMTCPILIGRNILMQLGVVDAGRTDLVDKPKKPNSSKNEQKEEPKK